MLDKNTVKRLANGRWREILFSAGIRDEFLDGKNRPCPKCGGKDRFRFSNMNGEGSIICNQCGRSGDLFGAVMWLTGDSFNDVVNRAGEHYGAAPATQPLPPMRFSPPKEKPEADDVPWVDDVTYDNEPRPGVSSSAGTIYHRHLDRDEMGNVFERYHVTRKVGPDGKKQIYKPKGHRKADSILYNLHALKDSDRRDDTVYFCEGEKDADRLAALGYLATTCGSSGDWKPEYAAYFRGRDVVILGDDDAPGRKLTRRVIGDILGVAASVKAVNLVPSLKWAYGLTGKTYDSDTGGDVSDLIAAMRTVGHDDAAIKAKLEETFRHTVNAVRIPRNASDAWLRDNLQWLFVDESNSADGENSFTADMNRAMNKPGTGLNAAKERRATAKAISTTDVTRTAAKVDAANRRKPGDPLPLMPLSEIEDEEVEWLIPGMIPLKMLTLIVGMPGVGKSWLTCDIAARLTRGDGVPYFGGARAEPCNVLIINAEDGAAQVRTRLESAEADLDRVCFFAREKEGGDHDVEQFSLKDADRLDATLEKWSGVRMVVIDPVASHLGDLNENSNTEVRSVLTPLSEIAERMKIAIVLVTHIRKGNAASVNDAAIDRVMGSRAIAATVRMAWYIGRDHEDPTLRRMAIIKGNILSDEERKGVAFRIVDRQIEYVEESTVTANELAAPPVRKRNTDDGAGVDGAPKAAPKRGRPSIQRIKCKKFIRNTLVAHGRKMLIGKVTAESPTDTLGRLCYDEGYKRDMVYVAKKSLKIVGSFDEENRTIWTLPADESEVDESEVDAAVDESEAGESVDFPTQPR